MAGAESTVFARLRVPISASPPSPPPCSHVCMPPQTLPETVWGYKCYGFYPTCDIDICVDLQGPPSDGIISPANYSFCDLQTTVNKMRGKVCVFDEELYKRTEFQMGFDFCFDVKGLYDDPSVEFTNGVFVFEDNFDYWLNKTDYSQDSIGMASALWNTMTNAEVADYCGVNLLPGDLDYPRMAPGVLRGEGSLHFSGVLERQAVTEVSELGGEVFWELNSSPSTYIYILICSLGGEVFWA